MLDCCLKVSEFDSNYTIVFTFGLISLGKVWTPLSLSYVLNSITAVLLLRWLWHWITHKNLYAIKQRNQTNMIEAVKWLIKSSYLYKFGKISSSKEFKNTRQNKTDFKKTFSYQSVYSWFISFTRPWICNKKVLLPLQGTDPGEVCLKKGNYLCCKSSCSMLPMLSNENVRINRTWHQRCCRGSQNNVEDNFLTALETLAVD